MSASGTVSIVDVSQPSRLVLLGQARLPGEPFDVADADEPTMLARAAFGPAGISEDFQILNSEVSEDQDRIQKAFKVFPDGLVAAPFSALAPYGAAGTCDNAGGGVELVEWRGDDLVHRALLPLPGNPRRALEHRDRLLALSDSHLRSFSLAELTNPAPVSELVVGECTPRDPSGGWAGGGWNNEGWDDQYLQDDYRACSAGRSSGAGALLLVGAALVIARRRRVPLR